MLFGEYQHTIDKKGRMFVPSKFRDNLGERFMICKGLDGKPCLFIYSMEEWTKLDEKIQQLPVAQTRDLQRFLFTGAAEVECDAQGRVLLPQNLREYASLEGNAAVVGASRHGEIWNTERWAEVSSECTPENIAKIMENLGI